MSKHSFEFKLKLVLEYLGGKSGGYGYLTNKYNLSNAVLLKTWVNQYEQFGEDSFEKENDKTYYSGEFKLRVIQYRHINKCSYRETANHFEIDNPSMIVNWQRKYLEEGFEGLDKSIGRPKNMPKDDKKQSLKKSKELCTSEKEELIKLREENEFLKASLAYEKKAKSLDSKQRIQNKEKSKVIIELRQEYPQILIKTWLNISNLPKSSFYEWVNKLGQINEEELQLVKMVKEVFEESNKTYGYRRITIALRKKGIIVNHKRIYRIMRENDFRCIKFTRRGRGYSSFKGEVGKIAENKLNRQFKVSHPNKVWVTDVTEFKINYSDKKLYLSPILDLFNGEILSFNISTSPTVKFTTDALDEALKRLPENHSLTIHSDQGFHYQHAQWVNRLKKRNITQSMSRRGNCIDNSPMENFFGLLKQEMYYGEKFSSIDELRKKIEQYIYWYNNKRIKEKLNGLSPIEFRQQAA